MEMLECVHSLGTTDSVGHVTHKAHVMRPKVDSRLRLMGDAETRSHNESKKKEKNYSNMLCDNVPVLRVFEINSI
jgi:hypothetical protein